MTLLSLVTVGPGEILFGFAPIPVVFFSSSEVFASMEPIDGCFLCVRVLDTEGVFLILETVGRDGGLLNELPGADRAAELDVGVDSVENLGATGLVNGFLRVSVSMVASRLVNLNQARCWV